jgi:hypothetical protein
MFDFQAAIKQATESLNSPKLELMVLGSSGSGKSSCIGTIGVKTLYLFGSRESHGPKAASVAGGPNIVPINFEFATPASGTSPRELTSDEAYSFLTFILQQDEWIKKEKFECIALDGMAVLENIVKGTAEFKRRCTAANGKHNTYKESEAAQELISEVINLLKRAQRNHGVHIVVTSMLDVKEVDAFGSILEASPKLQSFGLAETLVAAFGDVLVVGKMQKGGVVKYKFQSGSDLVRVSKDEQGNVKKMLNFSPRISGKQLPPVMDADLAEVVKLKATK